MAKVTESGPVTGRQTPGAAHLYTANYHRNLICTHMASRLGGPKYPNALPLFSQYNQTEHFLTQHFVQTVSHCCQTVNNTRVNKAQIPLSCQN